MQFGLRCCDIHWGSTGTTPRQAHGTLPGYTELVMNHRYQQ